MTDAVVAVRPGWRRWLRVPWPQSLLARMVLLIVLLLVAGQVAWIQFYRFATARTHSEQLASNIVGVLNTVSAALDTMPAAARRKFSERLPAQQNVRLLPATNWAGEDAAVPQSPLHAAVADELKRRTGGNAQAIAILEDADHSLWVKIRVKQQAWWVVFPPDAFGPTSVAWLGWSAMSLGLALAGGLALMLRVNRPLGALTAAAAAIAAGRTPPPLPERGPFEIRTLSAAFNRMTTALQAQEHNRAVLLAGVSHDLRTPLSRLRLALEMSRARLPDATRDGMEQDIEDMDAIIDQFLEFARDGAAETADPVADLNGLVRHLADRYEKRGAPVRVHLRRLPPLRLKPLAVQRMITNLVDNALRHGAGDVEIETRRDGAHAVLTVLDRGPGIPEDALERVMQPFTRLETARSDAGGSGLGLAIVDRVARMHGGAVTLSARDGGGLEARVELPVEGRSERV
ncbi:MAG: ATP-binding protein [Burkholderiales bacterium]|nr:ATP-binding protein [Burkholderiales bacterium]